MKRYALIYVLLVAVALSACAESGPAHTQVWIDVPLDGVEVEAGTVPVQSHAASRDGIARVELWVNGVLYRSDENPTPGEPVIYVIQPWVPTAPGDYSLQVRAYSTAELASPADQVTVHVSGEATEVTETPTAEFITPTPTGTSTPATDTPTPTDTPVPPTGTQVPPTDTPVPPTDTPIPPTATFTPTPTPQPQIKFWADATTVAAGSCTTVRWETANVKAVFFNGQGLAGIGTHQTCPCSAETHTLDVLLPNEEHDIRTLTINVTGSCVTPTPTPTPTATPDAVPPPAPALQSPSDGWEAPCSTPSVTLEWQAVSDPSGVASYDVDVEYDNAGYWVDYRSLSSTSTSVVLAPAAPATSLCEGTNMRNFRWRVRARDGAGNPGSWSGWFYFKLFVVVY
jgi:hypothetical protein